jgi:hypothetical protein
VGGQSLWYGKLALWAAKALLSAPFLWLSKCCSLSASNDPAVNWQLSDSRGEINLARRVLASPSCAAKVTSSKHHKGLGTPPAMCPTPGGMHVAGCSCGSHLHQCVKLQLLVSLLMCATTSYAQLQATPVGDVLPWNWLQATVPGGMPCS